MPNKNKATTGLQDHNEPSHVVVDTISCHSDGPVENCFCTKGVQDFLFTYSEACKISRDVLLSLLLVFSLTGLGTIFETAAAVEILMIIQDPYFYTHLFNIQVRA